MIRLLTCVFLIAHALDAGVQRDWVKHPAVVELDVIADLYAVGDAHGDYVRLVRALNAAGLVDQSAHWIGGSAVLVVTGDMIDKGPRAVDVLRLMHTLQLAAEKSGGHVIALAGNHEAEFLADPAAPKGKEFAAELKAGGVNPADAAACKGDVGEFLCSLPFAARVNDWFFSHGGNTAGRSIAQIKSDLQDGVMKDGFATQQLIGDGSLLEARLNGVGKGREPWIDAALPARSEQDLLNDYARALGVRHIVEGHVPGAVHFTDGTVRETAEMFQIFGLLFLIDTGMSEGVGNSQGAVLHITSRAAEAWCPDGSRVILWNSAQKQNVGRAAPCK